MIEIMNEQHTHFISEMSECGLLYETYPSLLFPRLKTSLYDDCESNFVDNAHFTDLEEAFCRLCVLFYFCLFVVCWWCFIW